MEKPNTPEVHEETSDTEETFFAGIASTGPSNTDLPRTLKEALSHPDGELWKSALEEELLSLNTNAVYDTVPLPKGVKPITSKPVFRIKFDQNGTLRDTNSG
ncbi:hypothetical protein SERLA73DRAFT_81262, partial [Serpula lacrymans var. lacrymans S7.3]